jgi:hypothetical protein
MLGTDESASLGDALADGLDAGENCPDLPGDGFQLTFARRVYQRLRERGGGQDDVVFRVLLERSHRAVVVSIDGIEERHDDARIEDDQRHSSRSSSR